MRGRKGGRRGGNIKRDRKGRFARTGTSGGKATKKKSGGYLLERRMAGRQFNSSIRSARKSYRKQRKALKASGLKGARYRKAKTGLLNKKDAAYTKASFKYAARMNKNAFKHPGKEAALWGTAGALAGLGTPVSAVTGPGFAAYAYSRSKNKRGLYKGRHY